MKEDQVMNLESSDRDALRDRSKATYVAAGFVLTAAALLPGCASHVDRKAEATNRWNQVRARMKYDLALEQYERGRADTAIETVNEAIAADPTSSQSHLLLAQCYLEQGKIVSARRAAEAAKAAAPESAAVEYTLGVIAEQAEQLDSALAHYRQARELDPRQVDYVVAQAECLAAMDRLAEAHDLVSKNMQAFDSDGTLEMLAAQIDLLKGERAEALRDYGLAIERSGCRTGQADTMTGACATLIEEYGRLLSEMGHHTETVTLLHPYVAARQDVPPSVVAALCTSYLETARPEDAKRLLRDEVERHPEHARNWMLLARASMAVGDWMTARRSVDQLRQLAPRSAEAHLLRGFVCWKQDDPTAALEAVKRALELEPDDAYAHCLMGQVLEELGRGGDAAAHYERALRIDPQLAWARELHAASGSRADARDGAGVTPSSEAGERTP